MDSGRKKNVSDPPSDMGMLLQQISSVRANSSEDRLPGYFKNAVSLHEVSYAIPTIPEGSTIKTGPIPMSTKTVRDETSSKSEKHSSGSPPPHSSAATTGTTTTPTSVGGNSDATVVSSSTAPVTTSPEPTMPNSEGFNPGGVGGSERRSNRTEQQSWSENFESQMNSSKYTSTPPTQSMPAPEETFTNSPNLGSISGRYNAAAYPCAIKLLVSNNVAGYIIGRSGQTVSELQAQSSTRIKLSQTGDYFPGTQDRVCLVQGQVEHVKMAMRMLLERFYMLQEQQNSQGYTWQPRPPESGGAAGGTATTGAQFEFVVRLLVPASSCGMIIGKSGSNIKHMEETTGVTSVRLSPKEGIITDPSYPPTAAAAALIAATSERVVTVSGPNMESCVQCTFIILDGMTLHPEICRYTNMTTSYSRVLPTAAAAAAVGGGGGPSFATGLSTTNNAVRGPLLAIPNTARMQGLAEGFSLWEPQQQQQQQQQQHHHHHHHHQQQHHQPPLLEKRVSSSPELAAPHLFLEGTIMTPVSPHFGQSCESANMPAGMSYSSRDVPLTFPHPQSSPPPSSPLLYLMGGMPPPPPSANEPPRLPGCSSAPDLIAMGHQDSLVTFEEGFEYLQPPQANTTISSSHGSSSHLNFAGSMTPGLQHHVHQQPPLHNNAMAPTSLNSQLEGFMGQVLVPDAFIGLILGRGGRTLHELQVQSGTRIRISQRGEYVPGSRDRIVTIKGPTAQSIHLAQVLIHQRMAVLPLPAPAASAAAANIMRSQSHGIGGIQQQQQQQQHAVGYASTFGTGSGNMSSMAPLGIPPPAAGSQADVSESGQANLPQSSSSSSQKHQAQHTTHSSSSSS